MCAMIESARLVFVFPLSFCSSPSFLSFTLTDADTERQAIHPILARNMKAHFYDFHSWETDSPSRTQRRQRKRRRFLRRRRQSNATEKRQLLSRLCVCVSASDSIPSLRSIAASSSHSLCPYVHSASQQRSAAAGDCMAITRKSASSLSPTAVSLDHESLLPSSDRS